MKTNTNSRYAVAVLIDGDNASFEKMEDIMGFVSRYGDAVVRRIYGDWTRKALSAWKGTARAPRSSPVPAVPGASSVSGRTDRTERRDMPRIGLFVLARSIDGSSFFL